MKLTYPIKLKYKDGMINELISPHLKINLFSNYLDLASKTQTLESNANVNLNIKLLQLALENYVTYVQSNNYKLRYPDLTKIGLFEKKDQWVNVEINLEINKGPFEKLAQITSVLVFFASFVLGECFFVIAARMNKVSYTTILIPSVADFLMSGIIYAYSGATSNMIYNGRELDDLFYNKKFSPDEEKNENNHPLFSTWNLSRCILCILALSSTVLSGYNFWQSIMSMRKEFQQSDINDPVVTPAFIYNLAIITIIVDMFYETIKLSSFALQATNVLEKFLNNCFAICSKNLSYIRVNRYTNILKEEEQTSSELDDVIFSSTNSPFYVTTKASDNEQDSCVYLVSEIKYNNMLLNKPELMLYVKEYRGITTLNKLIDLLEDKEAAKAIFAFIEQYGIKHVIDFLFGDSVKNCKVEASSSNDQVTIENEVIGQNFFLTNKKGKGFIQVVAINFDAKTLDKILEIGRDQDIAEQIINEAEIQGIERVVYTLLGKELPEISTTGNLENILSTEELNQLRIVPNGIFNSWSNKAYYKIADYIDNLAKNLDDMLNTGKSGNQVAITIALLEEWLGFSVSGQRFIDAAPLYYNPNDDDWTYGGSGSSDGGNNSSAGNFDNQYEVVGLVLPLYNGTDYNITDHQM